jgi:hypothetical protein
MLRKIRTSRCGRPNGCCRCRSRLLMMQVDLFRSMGSHAKLKWSNCIKPRLLKQLRSMSEAAYIHLNDTSSQFKSTSHLNASIPTLHAGTIARPYNPFCRIFQRLSLLLMHTSLRRITHPEGLCHESKEFADLAPSPTSSRCGSSHRSCFCR